MQRADLLQRAEVCARTHHIGAPAASRGSGSKSAEIYSKDPVLDLRRVRNRSKNCLTRKTLREIPAHNRDFMLCCSVAACMYAAIWGANAGS